MLLLVTKVDALLREAIVAQEVEHDAQQAHSTVSGRDRWEDLVSRAAAKAISKGGMFGTTAIHDLVDAAAGISATY